MKSKQIFKISLDVIMTALFMAMMAYHVTGSKLHEWLGIVLFILFILHHILNYKWYAGLFKGKWSAARIFAAAVNFLLLAAMVGMMISGVMLSNEVFGFLEIRAGMFGRRLHMLSTSWGYILMSMHIGLHWGMIMGTVKKKIPNGKASRTCGHIGRIIALLVSVYGVRAFISRQLAERLFLLVHFAFFDYSEPAVFFFADYLCIMVLFVAGAYYLSRLLRKSKNERS
ncbi:MAG: DUF4405 domain-containing protein [Ruminococcus sp.]|nr:DUF4405 domain-containing protein [Ruminococcus sp.]MCM1381003.1 DUF4405 domain-containing protein [Muribaculaceae bacterium]MCM1479240.1 DUF4405 domain-containing protein [Muribaculaceae bacterium]